MVSHCPGWHGCKACQKLAAARKRLSGDAQRCQGTAGKENGAACPTACDHNEEENSHSCIQINVTATMCFCPKFFLLPLVLLKASIALFVHQRWRECRAALYSCLLGLISHVGFCMDIYACCLCF